MSRARFFLALGLISLVGFGVRTAFVLGVAQHDTEFYDAFYYELQAYALADGRGFTDPVAYLPGGDQVARPAADHPPVTAVVLAGVAWLFGREELVLRFTTVAAGVATVFLLGLLGRVLAGARAGLVAASLGAIYPFLWLNDGLIMSEAFAALAVTGSLLLVYRLRSRPHIGVAVALGVSCGIAALTRAELLALVPGFVLVLLLASPRAVWRRRLGVAAAVVVGSLVVLAPWAIYNQARFQESVLISTNEGLTLLGSNCDTAYHGREIGLWVIQPGVCTPVSAPPGDQSVASNQYRREALVYMRDHASRVPVVMAVRLGRTWNLFKPWDMLRVNEKEGRPRWATTLGLVVYYPLAGLAVAGAVVVHRRRGWLGPLLVPVVIVTLTSLAFYGQTRLRLPAEPSLVALAGVAGGALWDRWGTARRGNPPSLGDRAGG